MSLQDMSPGQRKKYLRNRGMLREERVIRRRNAPDPSRGGSRGFPKWYKLKVLELAKNGVKPEEHKLASKSSVRRWKIRPDAYEMTGNKPRQGMHGHHRFLLAVFKKVWPQATANQCAVWIACHSVDHAVYTESEVSRAIIDMGLTRKKSSTTAYQAFNEVNIELHYKFWHYPSPAGIRGTRRKRLMDADEMAIELKDADTNYGHAVRGMRVRKVGNYGRGNCKFTVIMAIEAGDPDKPASERGSVEDPRIWYRISTDAGTSIENYIDFLNEDLFRYLAPDEPQRTLMHDNLSAHKHAEVVETIYNAGHTVICRPPYRPHEAPIEFAFDQFACEIRNRWASIRDEKDLVREMHNVLGSKAGMGGFDKQFQECGYKW